MGDGGLRILKDDEPLDRYRWNVADMVEAVTTFQEITARTRRTRDDQIRRRFITLNLLVNADVPP